MRDTNDKTNEKDLLRLVIVPFSKDEKEIITSARKKVGIDRPMFYHNAILKVAKEINGNA